MRLSFSCRSALGWALLSLIASHLGAHTLPAPVSSGTRHADSAVASPTTLRPLDEFVAHLPPAPAGVVDLTFSEFFGPIGDRGLEYSPKLRLLAGQRVRIAGFVVRQELTVPGLLLFTCTPVSTHETEYGFCDDLPSATLHVVVPASASPETPWQAGPVALTGRLELGPRAEADGRNSVVRLFLDSPPPGDAAPATPVTSQR